MQLRIVASSKEQFAKPRHSVKAHLATGNATSTADCCVIPRNTRHGHVLPRQVLQGCGLGGPRSCSAPDASDANFSSRNLDQWGVLFFRQVGYLRLHRKGAVIIYQVDLGISKGSPELEAQEVSTIGLAIGHTAT